MDDQLPTELTALSLAQAGELVRRRQVSPIELAQACLERIQRYDGKLNSFLTLTAEFALQQARRAEQRLGRTRRDPAQLGRLFGLPLSLKDLYETQGVRTTAGSRFFAENIPEQDAAVVSKLKAAGAILLGKTNMHEIALGLTNVNPHYGACRNPWALERITGGSSGGSAAALAADFCLGSLGSDTGGSIRVPAALCGVVGLKPTYGRVSLRGVLPLSWNLDHSGPMARRMEDAAILLQAIAGYDPEDPYSIQAPVPNYLAQLKAGVASWRIALIDDPYLSVTTPEIRQLVAEAAQVFEQLGARVGPSALPGAYDAAVANGLMVTSDAAAYHQERLALDAEQFGEDVRQRVHAGAAYTSTQYIHARRTQTLARRRFQQLFEQFDLLLLPTTAVPALPIEGPDAIEQARVYTRYTAPFNLTGLPALSLPCGFTAEGLPVGLQIVGPAWSEAQVLRAGYAYETSTPWHTYRPSLEG